MALLVGTDVSEDDVSRLAMLTLAEPRAAAEARRSPNRRPPALILPSSWSAQPTSPCTLSSRKNKRCFQSNSVLPSEAGFTIRIDTPLRARYAADTSDDESEDDESDDESDASPPRRVILGTVRGTQLNEEWNS